MAYGCILHFRECGLLIILKLYNESGGRKIVKMRLTIIAVGGFYYYGKESCGGGVTG